MINNFDLNDYPLWTALITPFSESGEVDYIALEQLVAEQQAANNGILLLGSTGEGLALSQEQLNSSSHLVNLVKAFVPNLNYGSNDKQKPCLTK